MIEAYIRPVYQRFFVDPLAKRLVQTLRPNHITLIAGCFGLAVPLLLVNNQPMLAVLLLLLSGFCDTLDGTLARLQHTSSALGTVLDITFDRVVEFAVVLGLLMLEPAVRGPLCVWMLGAILICVTTFLVVGLFSENTSSKSFHYSPGLIERPEAFGFFAAMILLPEYFTPLAIAFILLVVLTSVLRLVQFVEQVAREQ